MAGLQGKKNQSVPKLQFCRKTVGSSHVQLWLVVIAGWRLAVGGGGGGWWRLVVCDWWLVGVGGWRLAVGGGWQRLAVGGWEQLAVDGWWSLGAVLKAGPQQNKIGFPKDPPRVGSMGVQGCTIPPRLRL